MDKERFAHALNEAMSAERGQRGIGTLSEKSVHAVLKRYFSEDTECTEIKVGGYVADIVGKDGIIEIQTRSVWRLQEKLQAFLPVCRVTVVYPVEAVKYIQWTDPETGELLQKRRSPKKLGIYDGIAELYGIRTLLSNENLRVCFAVIETLEMRLKTGAKRGRAKAKEKLDKIPTAMTNEIYFENANDYAGLLPKSLGEEMTAAEFSTASGISRELASKCLSVLCAAGALELIGKRGRTNLYKRACI